MEWHQSVGSILYVHGRFARARVCVCERNTTHPPTSNKDVKYTVVEATTRTAAMSTARKKELKCHFMKRNLIWADFVLAYLL